MAIMQKHCHGNMYDQITLVCLFLQLVAEAKLEDLESLHLTPSKEEMLVPIRKKVNKVNLK